MIKRYVYVCLLWWFVTLLSVGSIFFLVYLSHSGPDWIVACTDRDKMVNPLCLGTGVIFNVMNVILAGVLSNSIMTY